ncbi:MAG: choline-sulfatase [Acidimicrobiales bacterium]
MNQPNILLVMADQLGAPWLQSFGGTTVRSPTIDRLAADGVSFRSAYTPNPLCAPARFSMMSGQLSSRIGAYDNASEFPASVPTFAHYLRSAGYQTSLAGKMHFVGPDQLHGYEERLTTDIYPADFGWTPNWREPDERFDWWFHNMDSVTNAGVADVTNQLDYDDDVGFHAIRKLRDLARTSDDRPWFLTVSFTHPHDPYVARREFWDLYADTDISPPVVPPIPAAAADPHSLRLRRVVGADVTDVSPEHVTAARRAYFANISYVDDWLRQLLQITEHHGLDDDLVVIFTADHGDMLGERGLWYKMCFFEHSARVPLIVHAPDRFGSAVVDANVGLLDLAPTLIDLAGAPVPSHLDGSTLLPFLDADGGPGPGSNGAADPQRAVLAEYFAEGAIAPIFMIRRDRWKYVWSPADPAQLYDLDGDPSELTNLALESSYLEIAAAFEAEVHERWDVERINLEVLASQQARADVDRAARQGRFQPWDYQPPPTATDSYMRNHLDLNDVEAGRRA